MQINVALVTPRRQFDPETGVQRKIGIRQHEIVADDGETFRTVTPDEQALCFGKCERLPEKPWHLEFDIPAGQCQATAATIAAYRPGKPSYAGNSLVCIDRRIDDLGLKVKAVTPGVIVQYRELNGEIPDLSLRLKNRELLAHGNIGNVWDQGVKSLHTKIISVDIECPVAAGAIDAAFDADAFTCALHTIPNDLQIFKQYLPATGPSVPLNATRKMIVTGCHSIILLIERQVIDGEFCGQA